MRKMRNQVSIIIALLSVWWSRVGGSRNWTSSTTLYSLNWSGDPDHSYRTQLPEASPGMSPATPAATYWSSSSTQPPPPQVSSHNSPDVPVIETDQPPPLQVSSHNSPDVSSIVTDQAPPPQVSSHDSQDVSSIVTDEPPLPQVSSHKLRGVPAIVTDQPPPLQVSTYNSPDVPSIVTDQPPPLQVSTYNSPDVPSIVTDQPPPPQELPHYSHDVSGIVTQQLPAPQASLHDLQDVFGIVSSSQGVAWPSPSSPLPTMTSPAHHVFSSPSPAAGGDHPPHILSLLKQNNLSKSSQSPLHPTDHSAGSSLPVSASSTWSGVWAAPQGCLPPLTAAGGNYMVTLRPHSSTFQYAVALTHIPRLTHFTVCLSVGDVKCVAEEWPCWA
ncbi:uncharacterized protein [Panulirus ornatus]|uniref:uncharacterized protein n=1 Tax=Panulirus ornatus TaxID=150431 RepID=UPI003A89051E